MSLFTCVHSLPISFVSNFYVKHYISECLHVDGVTLLKKRDFLILVLFFLIF